MSADLFREAAAKMREDHPWDQEHLDGPFYSALADLLDVWADNDLIDSGFSLPEERECLTDLARAYLGCTCPTDAEIRAAIHHSHQQLTGGNNA